MSNEILDDFKQPKEAYYAKKAYKLFLITVICFAIPMGLMLFIPVLREAETVFAFLSSVAMFISLFTSFVGLGYGIKSFIKKEESPKKYIGTIGNFIFVAIWIVSLIINLKDLDKFLNS